MYNFLPGFFPLNEWNQNPKSKLSIKSGKLFIQLQTLTVPLPPPIQLPFQLRTKISVSQAAQDLNAQLSLKEKKNHN